MYLWTFVSKNKKNAVERMRELKRTGVLLLAVLIFLSGCSPRKEGGNIGSQIVREIRVTVRDANSQSSHYYNTPEKMHKLLGYIRRLPPLFSAQQVPEGEREFLLELTCADGSRKRYHQVSDRFFQEGDGPWQIISPSKGGRLWQILMTTPNDLAPDK